MAFVRPDCSDDAWELQQDAVFEGGVSQAYLKLARPTFACKIIVSCHHLKPSRHRAVEHWVTDELAVSAAVRVHVQQRRRQNVTIPVAQPPPRRRQVHPTQRRAHPAPSPSQGVVVRIPECAICTDPATMAQVHGNEAHLSVCGPHSEKASSCGAPCFYCRACVTNRICLLYTSPSPRDS
eukprot:TRINITY_DN1431_c0_g1_i3.p1 TRINITY_DN1431_c0_g1~~TRINITY_DN1431_c0_g1_i3.p1  ORF type:complete len:180 (-),score=8.34 TRINITY_DN1431_c0_g1_i3:109-648(-)